MSTLTIKFKGLQEQLLDLMVDSGVAQSKSEAIRMSILIAATELKLLDDRVIVDFLRKELSRNVPSPDELFALIERAKHETITR